MKKLLLMLLALVMAFAMFSCTPDEEESDGNKEENNQTVVETPKNPIDTPMTDLPF